MKDLLLGRVFETSVESLSRILEPEGKQVLLFALKHPVAGPARCGRDCNEEVR
ncbi:MAG TPA: hypothetical protein VIK92_01395 [Thermaerobacter sp.]